MKQIKSTLYGQSKAGKVKVWKVFVDPPKVVVEYGYLDGKKQTQETLCEGKNIGRSNETTPEEQAIKEAESKWTKQKERKLYVETIEELSEPSKKYPMLANDAKKVPHRIVYPCDVQPKLDGVRVLVHFNNETDELNAISRTGVDMDLHDGLSEELRNVMTLLDYEYLDGELFLPGLKLQEIDSAAKNKDNPKHYELEFHCFDVPSRKQWYYRALDLQNVDDIMFEFNEDGVLNYLKVVQTLSDIKNFTDLEETLDRFIGEGYEGIVIRNLTGNYEWSVRSGDLLKLKRFKDSEAKVIDCREDKLFEGVLTCQWTNPNGDDVEFELKMKGKHESRIFNNSLKLLGKWINFTYQDLNKAGIPTFAVGQCVRECDNNGNPIL